MPGRSIFLALIGLLLAISQGNAHPSCGTDASTIPRVFEGFFDWSAVGETAQQIVLILDPLREDAEGRLVAKGKELYNAGARFHSIDVTVRINPCTLRFELVEAPNPDAFAHDSSVGEPLIGAISSDFKTVFGPNESGASSDVFPDFVLRAKSASDQIVLAR